MKYFTLSILCYIVGSALGLWWAGENPLIVSVSVIIQALRNGWFGVSRTGLWGLFWPLSILMFILYYYGQFIYRCNSDSARHVAATILLCIGRGVAASTGCVVGYWGGHMLSMLVDGRTLCLLALGLLVSYTAVSTKVAGHLEWLISSFILGVAWFSLIVGMMAWGTAVLGTPIFGDEALFGMFAVLGAAWIFVMYGTIVRCAAPILYEAILSKP